MKTLLLRAWHSGRRRVAPPKAAPTFSREVAPILYEKCAPCHRPGDVAPYSLLDYATAKKFAPMISQVVQSGQMPPWKPHGMRGQFVGERRLTPEERALLVSWAAAGAPQGERKSAPAPPHFPDKWQLGRPDIVLRIPPGMTIPAEGEDVYRFFPLALNLPVDRIVKAVEIRPGNRRIVHHSVIILDRSGAAQKLDEKEPGPGYSGFGGFGFIPAGFLSGYAPGMTVRPGDGKVAGILGKGHTDVVLQMHYHPSGKPETDQSEIGIYFTDQKPEHNPAVVLMASDDADIPAGAKAHVIRDSFRIPTHFNATTVFPHMHLVGKDVKVWAELPDKSRRELLSIKDWNFNWQDTYVYKEPIRLPKDTVVRCEWTYDNSDANPRNPNFPPKRVMIGENSTDEMAGLIVGGYCDDGWGELALIGADLAHLLEVSSGGKRAREKAAKIKAKGKD